MAAGRLVPDAVVSALIDDAIGGLDPQQSLIFDGYPRTIAQADVLDSVLAKHGRALDHVIELAVDESALVVRIAGRFSCSGCGAGYHELFLQPVEPGRCDRCGGGDFTRRPDDNETTVRTRLAEYRARTEPILHHYAGRGIVSQVDGMGDVTATSRALDAIVT
jgi:adenylate kinase